MAVSHLDATLNSEDQTPRVWTQLGDLARGRSTVTHMSRDVSPEIESGESGGYRGVVPVRAYAGRKPLRPRVPKAAGPPRPRAAVSGGELVVKPSPATAVVVGRDVELAVTAGAVRRLADGQASVLAIEGEAGIGKTSAGAKHRRGRASRGMTVFGGQAHPFERTRPFGVLAGALELSRRSADPRRAAIGALLAGATPGPALAAKSPVARTRRHTQPTFDCRRSVFGAHPHRPESRVTYYPRTSDLTSRDDDRPRDVLVRSHHQFGLYGEPCLPEPMGNLVRPPAVAVDADRAARVALRGMARPLTYMKANQQRTSRPQHAIELREHRGHSVIRHVDHGPERRARR